MLHLPAATLVNSKNRESNQLILKLLTGTFLRYLGSLLVGLVVPWQFHSMISPLKRPRLHLQIFRHDGKKAQGKGIDGIQRGHL